MAEYLIQDSSLVAIGDAIREKTGKTNTLSPSEMASEISNIEVGIDTSDATAVAGDILGDKTAYVNGEKITGTIITQTSNDLTASGATVTVPAGYYAAQATKSVATATQATPSISVNSSGLITASATQTDGYVSYGTKNATKQLTTKASATITPKTYNQTIAAGTYLTGTQTIAGDADLVASNIKKGANIFGVAGSYDAVELNFKIVKYNSEAVLLAATPAENTIGVVTTTDITSWVFSATQPAGSAGRVWIATSDGSDVAFNVLKENDIKTYPISASQYINGTWVSKIAKTYQGGKWHDWQRYLFKNSDQCTGLTGGWVRSGMNMDGNHPNNGTINIGNVISLASTHYNETYGTVAAVTTVNPINLKNVKKIFFRGKATGAVAGYITTNKTGTWIDGSVVASVYIESTTTDTVELPVDTYNNAYYVNVASFRSSSGEVVEIWME